ncbi:hypothetical protein [Serratia marcescens]|uniref:hypothetical protein n=1 Tax=Serratia marcescens TaxID=615 RepID=UPI0034D4A2DA
MKEEENNKPEANKSSLTSGFGIIEKIWNWNWALRFSSIVLFVDIVLILRSGEGVLNWSVAGHEQLLSNLGFLAVSVAVFGLVVAILLPVLEEVVKAFYYNIYLKCFPQSQDEYNDPRPSGHVLADEVRECALREGNDFMLREYKEHQARIASDDAFRFQAGRLIFGTLLLALGDMMLSGFGYAQSSLISSSIQYLGKLGVVMAYLVLLGGFFLVFQVWFKTPHRNWMYYPPLADEEAAKEWEVLKGTSGYFKRSEE